MAIILSIVLEYIYSAWFRNTLLPPDDQDYEWVACIQINAKSKKLALEWGDTQTKLFLKQNITETFLSSEVLDKSDELYRDTNFDTIQIIEYGESVDW